MCSLINVSVKIYLIIWLVSRGMLNEITSWGLIKSGNYVHYPQSCNLP